MNQLTDNQRRIVANLKSQLADVEKSIAMLQPDAAEPRMRPTGPGTSREASIEQMQEKAADLRRLVEAWSKEG